eukprot:jgi/Mesen1/6813/ME000035S06202
MAVALPTSSGSLVGEVCISLSHGQQKVAAPYQVAVGSPIVRAGKFVDVQLIYDGTHNHWNKRKQGQAVPHVATSPTMPQFIGFEDFDRDFFIAMEGRSIPLSSLALDLPKEDMPSTSTSYHVLEDTCHEETLPNGHAHSGADVATVEEVEEAVHTEHELVDAVYTCIPPAEGEDASKCRLTLVSGAAMAPHPAKVARGGEDAYFMEGEWVGVADGASGWAKLGVNSGMYARELMFNCAEVVRDGELGPDPKAIIEESHSRVDLQGSCTATVAVLDKETHRLRVANIGDSGFMLIRDGAVVERSERMQHGFNAPFQIGYNSGDDPAEAQDYMIDVQGGDIVVLGTDGLFDNMFEEQIAALVTACHSDGKAPEAVAQKLVPMAQRNAMMTTGETPFCVDAKACGQKHEGGKKDDITVVVSYIN